jgi:hypothetical protein
LAETLAGEHPPIQLNGTLQGKPTFGCLILAGHIHELGDNPISLLLDSGVNNLTLFRETLGPGSNHQEFVDAGSFNSSGITTMETRTVRSLHLGRSEVDDLTVIAVAGQQDPNIEGLIPTTLFHSIFISHQRRIVILNPSLQEAVDSRSYFMRRLAFLKFASRLLSVNAKSPTHSSKGDRFPVGSE